MSLTLRDLAYALLIVAITAGAAHVIDRVSYGLAMTERGFASHRMLGANP